MKFVVSIILAISMLVGSFPMRGLIEPLRVDEIEEIVKAVATAIPKRDINDNIIEEEPVAKTDAEEEKTIVHTVTFLAWDDSVDFTVEVEHGESLSYIPDSEWENGIFDRWTRADNGETFRADTPIYEDVVYEPNFIFLEWFVLNALENGELSLEDCDPEEIREIAEYIRTLQ